MTADAPTDPERPEEAARAEFEAFGFRAATFQARFLDEDGSADLRPVAGFTCDGLGVHLDGSYWRICALGSGQPLGLMPTVSATRRLCTRILQLADWQPAAPVAPDARQMRRIREMQAEIVEQEAESLRRRADELAQEIAELEEKAIGFQARVMFGAVPDAGDEGAEEG